MTSSKNLKSSSSYYELLKACNDTGCPVCRVGAHSVKRYLESIFYEYVNDGDTRDSLLKSMGFCSEHVQLLLSTRIADSLGASIIYENIIKKILRELPNQSSSLPSQSKERAQVFNKFVSASDGLGACIACEQRERVSDRALHEIRNNLGDRKLRDALQVSDGLCFPHLAQLLEHIQNKDDIKFLFNLTKNKLDTRQSEMAELIRKNDYQFQSERITHEEALAWKKAMCMLAGVSISPTGDKHG